MKRSRLNLISKNKAKAARRFVPAAVLKAVKARSGGKCERMVVTPYFGILRCRNDAMNQPHHRLARSQGGEHTVENLCDLCFGCHNWATDHPEAAKNEGLVIPYRGYIHGSLEH